MRLPEIAARLRELSVELGSDELNNLAYEMARRKSTRAPTKSAPMTKEMIKKIKEMHADNPDRHQADIASELNINPGRVSEVLRGKRT